MTSHLHLCEYCMQFRLCLQGKVKKELKYNQMMNVLNYKNGLHIWFP